MKQKIIYLEGIRGTAAFIVVFAHFFQVFMPSVFEGNGDIVHFAFETPASKTPINLLFNGNFSVTLFFVLSGYVLSYRFFRDKVNRVIYSSAVRRYFRLAIPAFVSVIFAFALMSFEFGYFDDISPVTMSTMPDPYAADPTIWAMWTEGLFHTFFTYGNKYNPVLWTMTYELFGSFLIFTFLILLGKLRIRYIAYPLLIYCFLDSYYLGFVLGLLLSDLHNSGRNWLELVNRP
ncbi:acyltransferase family protein [Paenibacillus sp. SN-8-1]|uniref:acyltransferase family protein n=1 Tax=Paenibacillus sp. SN-8-1 TaxID=3435409 RepID=UPI003D9A59F8